MTININPSDIDAQALDRIKKARFELTVSRTFYAVLVANVEVKLSRNYPTMATNGTTHFVNPEFIMGLSKNHRGQIVAPQKLVLGVQAHESEHDARRHHSRRGARDPKEWNICTDYAINGDLIREGFELPEGALIDPKYFGMSAEDIYRTREIERAEQERQQQQQDQDDDQDDDGQDRESYSDDQDRESYSTEDDDDQGDGDDQGDDQGDGDDQGNDQGESDDQGDDQGNDQGDGDQDTGETGDQNTDGSGSASPQEGQGEADAEGGGSPTGPGENASGDSPDGQGEAGSTPISCGDPGQCGEVLDAGTTTAERADAEAKWETILRQAAMLAAKRGTAPGHMAREIEHADDPPLDWREQLRAFFDGGAATIETWSRPNRRFVGSGLYLPGRQRDGINKAVIAIDTSGSVTFYPGALEAIQIETQAVLDEGIVDEVIVLYGDAVVTRVDHYHNGDQIEFDPRGGGGTLMKPMFDHVRDEIDDASCIVMFTDLDIEPEDELGPQPACPVLWAVVGYPQRVKDHLKATPWNAPGIEVRP